MIVGSEIAVAEGQDGWLFLEGHGPHQTLESARDLSGWRDRLLPRLTANYLARHRRVTERGIPFIVVFAPEASGIYSEHLPPSRSVEVPTAAELLATRLRSEGVVVVCPSAAFREAKGAVDLYLRLDSHWSSFGAYLCYRQIVAALQGMLAVKAIEWRNVKFGTRSGFGDLGVHARPERKGPLQTVSVSGAEVKTAASIYDQREKNLRVSTCAGGTGRALVFRDSYANALAPYLERTFAETILIAPAPTMLDSAIDHYRPDVVILQVAERALFQDDFCFNDWDPRTFEQNYLEQASNPVGGKMQVEALRHIEGGRPAEAITTLAVAVALEGEHARVHNLAWALLNAGQVQLCHTLASRFAARTDDRFLRYLEAQAAFQCGRYEDGMAALDRALARQPNNALYQYLRAEWSYQRGEFTQAATAAAASVRYAPLHERSWVLLGGALQRTGQLAQAEASYGEADVIFGPDVITRVPP